MMAGISIRGERGPTEGGRSIRVTADDASPKAQDPGVRRGAFETLTRKVSPRGALDFVAGATRIRSILANVAHEGALVIAPLRGAMPVVWAAEGVAHLERPSGAIYLEVPIGVQRRYLGDRRISERSPRPHQKRAILERYLNAWLTEHRVEAEQMELMLLDEVQHGGTIVTAQRALRSLVDTCGLARRLRVIAALDSRSGAQSEPKTEAFRRLVANQIPDTSTVVVPMPMFAIDVQPLLDQVELDGDGSDLEAWSNACG
jgi:hypothetical protein